jgi:hypothetical protein
MQSLTAGKRTTHRRIAAGLAAVALAVAAPVALASQASTSVRQGVVHTHLDRSGTTVVSGYDGGVAIAPASAQR